MIKGGVSHLFSYHKPPIYVLTFISNMLIHINQNNLDMSILFSTFVVEIRNISQTPKKQKIMTTTNPNIIKALEYINKKGLTNVWWHIVTNEVDAHAQYVTEERDITLPPHIAIWAPDVTVDYEYLQLPADKVFTLQDDEEVTIIYL